MIKYLGSKRRLVPALTAIAAALSARSGVDLFTGTTRVARAWKQHGVHVTAVDSASYSHVLARCFIGTDAADIDHDQVQRVVAELNLLPGRDGYFTETFCRRSRFFQEHNGQRIDAIRDAIEDFRGTALHPVLLTSLLLAADRVDSTTGVQMAYLKQWAPRSFHDLHLEVPDLLPGPGTALRADATAVVDDLPSVDLAYLDPPYNHHRYESNYHIWTTLVAGDEPEHYGVACKRLDLRTDPHRSPFNRRREFAGALAGVVASLRANTVVVSYNDESWVDAHEIRQWLLGAGHQRAEVLTFDSARYVGARIGIHDPHGVKVGTVGRLRNHEMLVVAGSTDDVAAALDAARSHGGVVGALAHGR